MTFRCLKLLEVRYWSGLFHWQQPAWHNADFYKTLNLAWSHDVLWKDKPEEMILKRWLSGQTSWANSSAFLRVKHILKSQASQKSNTVSFLSFENKMLFIEEMLNSGDKNWTAFWGLEELIKMWPGSDYILRNCPTGPLDFRSSDNLTRNYHLFMSDTWYRNGFLPSHLTVQESWSIPWYIVHEMGWQDTRSNKLNYQRVRL